MSDNQFMHMKFTIVLKEAFLETDLHYSTLEWSYQ